MAHTVLRGATFERIPGGEIISQQDPPEDHKEIAKSDTDTYECARGVYVGTTGNVAIELQSENQAIYKNVPAGTVILGNIKKVLSTGTTASDFVLLG